MHDDLQKIVDLRHDAPHTVLGPQHLTDRHQRILLRAFVPDAATVSAYLKQPLQKIVRLHKIHPAGIFAAEFGLDGDGPLDYVLTAVDQARRRFAFRDAYNFPPTALDADDEACFMAGADSFAGRRFGAHPESRNGISGVRFGFWTHHAERVSVVGSFNGWDGRRHPMQRLSPAGLWELFIPDAKPGDYYKFEIRLPDGVIFLQTDPYGFLIEDAPAAAAIVCALDAAHAWQDDGWHANTGWGDAAFYPLAADAMLTLTGAELAEIKAQGYSHLALATFCDWESASAAFYAPHPRFGGPEKVMALIDRCHRQGLGIVLDGMPQCLPVSPHHLLDFGAKQQSDTSPAFCFDVTQPGVKNFLLSQVRFWRETYHIDGFRLDAHSHALLAPLLAEDATEEAGMLWLLQDLESDPASMPASEVVNRLLENRRQVDPYTLLGPHKHLSKTTAVIRALLPQAAQAYAYFPDQPRCCYPMQALGDNCLRQTEIPLSHVERDYRVHVFDREHRHHDILDAYAFAAPSLGSTDKAAFAAGRHYQIHRHLGAHLCNITGVDGVVFAVWAPNAAGVNLVGDFNDWQGGGHPLRFDATAGIWQLFVPAVGKGERYQFEIHTQTGEVLLKSDPYAFFTQRPPATASVVYPLADIHQWQDQDWLEQRRQANVWRMPISIYEVHLGSWMRGPDSRHLTYRELADLLIPYVIDMGFTHIEILPISEYPYDPSWGYQVSNFYAPTSRFGQPEELMDFIDQFHQHGIGVLLDWVAGHFPKDAHALARFDGTHLYEHADPRKGEHKDWGTLIFNYGRHEVQNFLTANALFWLEHYHFDGLRVDAVASMLYLDYSRKPGEWIPNEFGGNENLEAIEFLKHANYVVHGRFPGVLMIAEESTAWAGVSRPTDAGGLGFGFKWNMGWMHDMLSYLQTPPEYRSYHHHKLTFVFHYAFDENFILSLSHDEVVHLKGSLYTKMPGSKWEKFANLRLLFFFMFTHPGKKLNFMGAEFAQIKEWSEAGELQWPLLEDPTHRQLQNYFKTLNRLYCHEPVLHEMDCKPAGFAWIDAHNHEQSIVVYCRKAKDPRLALIVVINFSAVSRFDFRIGVPYPVAYTQIFNTNAVGFGGLSEEAEAPTYELLDAPWHSQEFSIVIDKVPALSALLLKPAPASSD